MNSSDRIKKAHVAIMQHKKLCVFSGLLACGKVTVTEDIPTACTDGWDVQYNPEFVAGLKDPELRFLVLHEALHKAYRHLHVWKSLWDIDPQLANIAADHFNNLSLVDLDAGEGFLAMPKVGVQPDPQYRGNSVSMIFDKLRQNPPPKDPQGGGGDGMDDHDWKSGNAASPTEQEMQGKEIDRAMRQGEIMRSKMQGKGSKGQSGVFGDLLTPVVDWRKVLRDFITETCAGRDESTWRRPNRRFIGDDVYMPSMMSTTMNELVIGFDTSGSCFGSAEMTRFVSEIKVIIEDVKPSKCHVVYCDSEVRGHQMFEDGQFEVQNLKPKGGGGTDLTRIFDWVHNERVSPDAAIVFTDGYTPFGTAPAYPVLWAMSSSIKSPWGTSISIE